MNHTIRYLAVLCLISTAALADEDTGETYPGELEDIDLEMAEISGRWNATTGLGITHGYGGRPLGATHEEEQRLQVMDKMRAREDSRRSQRLDRRRHAILDRRSQAGREKVRRNREAAARRADAAYEQVIGSMRESQRPVQLPEYEPRYSPPPIRVPSAEEYYQSKRTRSTSTSTWPSTSAPAPALGEPPAYPLPNFTEFPSDPGHSHEPNWGQQIRESAERLIESP